jgi:hypothetical protein
MEVLCFLDYFATLTFFRRLPFLDFSHLVLPFLDFSHLVLPFLDFSHLVLPFLDFSHLVLPFYVFRIRGSFHGNVHGFLKPALASDLVG